MIRHAALFRLKHAMGSAAEAAFLKAADVLAAIPDVQNFEKQRQVSSKNEFSFCFAMEFENQEAYDFYNHHPDHVAFVRDFWVPEVDAFLEVDTVKI